MRLKSAVAAVVGVVMLTLTQTTAAHAATGQFEFTMNWTTKGVLFDPEDGRCYYLNMDGPVTNNTNRSAYLYTNNTCTGSNDRVVTGQTFDAHHKTVVFL